MSDETLESGRADASRIKLLAIMRHIGIDAIERLFQARDLQHGQTLRDIVSTSRLNMKVSEVVVAVWMPMTTPLSSLPLTELTTPA